MALQVLGPDGWTDLESSPRRQPESAMPGWRIDAILDLGDVVQVGAFGPDGWTPPARCAHERVEPVRRLNMLAGPGRWDAAIGGRSGDPHTSPGEDCTCGHHFTDSKLAGRFATLFPQRHPLVPLVGYAVTQIAAHGEVYPGVCEMDPEGTWRAERLRVDGPMFVDLPHGTSTGLLRRLQERYPTARRGWVGGRPLRSVPAFWDPTGDAPWDPRINRGHQRDSQLRLGMLKTLEVMFDPRNTGNRLPPDLEVFVPAAAVCFHARYARSLEAADAALAAPMSARAEAVRMWRLSNALSAYVNALREPDSLYAAAAADPEFRELVPGCEEYADGPLPVQRVLADRAARPEDRYIDAASHEMVFGFGGTITADRELVMAGPPNTISGQTADIFRPAER
ncbi:hypothetical protein ACXYTP_17720 [Tsukamurella ocularis]